MLTAVVAGAEDTEALAVTMDSLQEQNEVFEKNIRVILILKKENQKIFDYINEKKGYWKEYLTFKVQGNGSVWKIYEEVLKELDTDYVTVVRAGDAWLKNALLEGCSYLKRLNGQADVMSFTLSFPERTKIPQEKEDFCPEEREILYDLRKEEGYLLYPATFEGCIFASKAVKGQKFDETHGYEIWDEFVLRILDQKRRYAVLKHTYFITVQPRKENVNWNLEIMHKAWYVDSLEKHCIPTVKYYVQKYGCLPEFVQTHLLFQIYIRFLNNQNQKNYHIFKEEELDDYFETCGEVLKYIKDDLLIKRSDSKPRLKITEAMSENFLQLKYGKNLKRTYRIVQVKGKHTLTMGIEGGMSDLPLYPKLRLDLMEEVKDGVALDIAAPGYVSKDHVPLTMLLNGKPMEVKETVRYADFQFFGRTVYRERTWRVIITQQMLGRENLVEAVLLEEKEPQNKVTLSIVTKRYPSKITHLLPYSYWTFRTYLVCFKTENREKAGDPCGILIRKAGLFQKIWQEIHFLKEIRLGERKDKWMFRLRLRYWLNYPKLHKKNIWITFDKLYKGGDCGEYFYKYMCSRKDTDVVPGYVINEGTQDQKRLVEEGYQPLIRGTMKQKMNFLYAKIIFGTHVGIPGVNGFNDKKIIYIQDRLRFTNMCIQHGLSVQDLSYDANRVFNNNKRYYCASHYEVENLRQPKYGYEDPEAIKLTGIPRYDGLVNQDQRQILITPTWRKYIAMPAVMGSARPYNPDFKHTDYFKIYNSLISDPRLIDTAARTGYKLIYLLHPITSAQIGDYSKSEQVEILQGTTVNYEKILTESSLMVTDYSGVQFDFAYMRKPVVYYHPPKLPPHYVEGGFFYDTQGFGEICTEHEELVNVLCEYMERECRLKPFYQKRQDDFFAFDDHKSCERIFNDAYEYQKG